MLAIAGDEWPLEHRRVLGCAIRVRNPYVDALSLAQVRALPRRAHHQDQLSDEEKAEYLALILATVTGVSAGLQNTGVERGTSMQNEARRACSRFRAFCFAATLATCAVRNQ